jgi:kynureninase
MTDLSRHFETGAGFAASLDLLDPLRPFRDRFYTREGIIYLDGNSLGLASRDAEAALLRAVAEWKAHAIDGWLSAPQPWFYMAEELGARMASLVGARPAEVVVTGTTTVNQHALVATFYRPDGRRTKILAEELAFPSDIYALQSQLTLRGLDPEQHLVRVASRDGRTLDEADLIAAMTEEVALVLLPGALYRSGQLLDMARLAAAARERGIPIGFDLSHSAGAVPHRLHDWGADFAFWCTYKYLNGGPGAAGALFVHERHFGRLPGLAGWFGSDKDRQFEMAHRFTPAAGAGAWQISTPTLFGTAPLYGSLAISVEAGVERIRAKSLHQTAYLLYLIDEVLAPYGFAAGTPREDGRRGGHVALEHAEAVRICKAIRARGVIPDFRPPNIIRLAPAPLYTSYAELRQAVEIIRDLVSSGEHERFSGDRDAVT